MKIPELNSTEVFPALRVGPAVAGGRRRPARRGLLVPMRVLLILAVAASVIPSVRAADVECAVFAQRKFSKPADYRQRRSPQSMAVNDDKKHIHNVEKAHFTREYQRAALRGDPLGVAVVYNLDYTLRHVPNHAPALFHFAIFSHLLKNRSPSSYEDLKKRLDYFVPVECYYQYAVRFAPDDPNVRNAYGRYLTRIEQHEEAIKVFASVVKLAPKSAAAHYNLGLAYFAAKKYDEAAVAARKAYKLGYHRTELKERLKRKEHW